MLPISARSAKLAMAAAAGLAAMALAGPATATASTGTSARPATAARPATSARTKAPQLRVRQLLNGQDLRHTFTPSGSAGPQTEPLSSPDDMTRLGDHLFTAFQNGVGPQGEPSPDGNADSTVVEFTTSGAVIAQWDVHGKCDGLTADPRAGVVIATVNEDANSSVYTIRPGAHSGSGLLHYSYNEPLPHFGGTDAISVYRGQVLISASAPGTTGAPAPQPTYPAVYSVRFDRASLVATVTPLFYDEDPAVNVTAGPALRQVAPLALTDPDSNEVVPPSAPRFGGDFMLTSQGDQEQVFLLRGRGHRSGPRLAVLELANAVDDTAWTAGRGVLVGTNTSGDTVDEITGRFRPGTIFVAVTPCDASDAPATCPGPAFPANFLGTLNPWTGAITPAQLAGPAFQPQGLIFVSR
ncbi:MAG TPA: hypothetical protein VGI58_02945 [Streptosporangiaceae bacterium]